MLWGGGICRWQWSLCEPEESGAFRVSILGHDYTSQWHHACLGIGRRVTALHVSCAQRFVLDRGFEVVGGHGCAGLATACNNSLAAKEPWLSLLGLKHDRLAECWREKKKQKLEISWSLENPRRVCPHTCGGCSYLLSSTAMLPTAGVFHSVH
ncbi:unnamed protein product [Discosporangium mesarthrocarpum]